MPRHPTKLTLTAAVLAGAILTGGLAGCNRTQSTEALLAEAAEYQQKGDLKAALIQLKNAVANSPEDGEARLALGTLQLSSGDLASAEKELGRARALGIPAERVLPQLGRVLIQQGKFKEVLELVTPEVAGKSAPLLSLRGDGLLGSGKPEEAEQTYMAALAANPNSGEALMGMARLSVSRGDRDATLRYVDEAVAKDPKNPEVHMMRGMTMRALGKQDEALAAFGQAVKLKPDHRSAHIERANIEIGRRNFDAAKVEVAAAEKNAPGSLQVVYTRALFEFSQGKHAAAKDALQKILKVAPDHLPSVLLAGASELALGSTNQAEQHLRKYLESAPTNVYARKLLAQAQLKNSQPGAAVETLAPALKDASKDAQLLALAGESYMQVRDFEKASDYLGQAAALEPQAAAVRTSLGLSKLAQGDRAGALSELEKGATLDPKSIQATMALVQTELGMKRPEKAMAAVQALEKQQPDNPQVHQMKGAVYLFQGNTAGARAAFEKALSLQPGFLPAATNLARLDLQENKPDAARARFTAILDKDKNNADAMAALAALEMQQKRIPEATAWLQKASDANPTALGPALALGGHYLATDQAPKAQALARKLQTNHPADPGVLELLGQTQVAAKDFPGALETYGKLVTLQPKSGMVHLRLATVNMLMKNDAAAAASLQRAISVQPDLVPARAAAVEVALRRDRQAEALQLARDAQRDYPKHPLGYVLEGDAYLFKRQGAQAAAAYEKALAIAPTTPIVLKLAEALGAAGKAAEGTRRVAAWTKAHPNDLGAAHYLSNAYLGAKDAKSAIPVLEGIIQRAPQDAMALNNLAWAYGQTRDARALATAERAAKIAGDNPAIMDTLGWLLVEQGNIERGLPLLKKAAAAAPNSPEINYHLAAGLAKAGDKEGARKSLDKLLADHQAFPQRDDAQSLRKTL